MRKFLLSILLPMISVCVQAQIAGSTGKRVIHVIDTEVEEIRYIKGGMSLGSILASDYSDYVGGSESLGYVLVFGVDKPLWQSSTAPLSAFWGYEAGLGSRGLSDCFKHNLRLTPKVGIKITSDKFSLSYHCGLYVSLDYAQGSDNDDYDYYYGYNNFDAGIQLGIDFCFSQFFFGMSMTSGFIPMFSGDGVISEAPYVQSVMGDFFNEATTMNTSIHIGLIF